MSSIDTLTILRQEYQNFSDRYRRKINSPQQYYFQTPEAAAAMQVDANDREGLLTICREALRDLNNLLIPLVVEITAASPHDVVVYSSDNPLINQDFVVEIPDDKLVLVYRQILILANVITGLAVQHVENPGGATMPEQEDKVEQSNLELAELLGISLVALDWPDAVA